MPLAETSLAAQTTGQPLRESDAIGIMDDIAHGLTELHQLGIIYRDLKPANVLLIDARWCLADFGISRNSAIATATFTLAMRGTTPYMAPEVWDYKPPTIASDLYSLGVVAYELLTGVPPFTGTDAELDRAHRTTAPAELPETISAPLRRLGLPPVWLTSDL